MFYSAETKGFYDPAIHAAVPADAIEITDDAYAALIAGQEIGKIIQVIDGTVVAVDRPEPTAEELLAAERAGMVVTRAQARIALHQAGHLATIEAAIADADVAVQIAWADSTTFRRNSPTLAAVAALVGMDDIAIDNLFRAAAQIIP